jgi:hypothetical protein
MRMGSVFIARLEITASKNGANGTGRAILRVRVITEETLKDMDVQPLSELQPNLLHHAGLHVAQRLAQPDAGRIALRDSADESVESKAFGGSVERFHQLPADAPALENGIHVG